MKYKRCKGGKEREEKQEKCLFRKKNPARSLKDKLSA